MMIEKFNGIFYLIVFLIHFLGFAAYAYQTDLATKTFLDKFGIDDTGAGMRMAWSFIYWSCLMALYMGCL